MDRGEIGRTGESIACRFLELSGFTIVERNYRRPWGEIDIIAQKGSMLHFVEIKSVLLKSGNISREMQVDPLEHVSRSKLQKVARTASLYMHSKSIQLDYQIDVLGVYLDGGRKIARCELYSQALG
jgi:putative endonuclease